MFIVKSIDKSIGEGSLATSMISPLILRHQLFAQQWRRFGSILASVVLICVQDGNVGR